MSRPGRTPVIAGNWKMHTTIDEAVELVEAMIEDLEAIEGVERIICPPYVALNALVEYIEDSEIHLGAQNMAADDSGAYTGQISPVMLRDVCEYVILGHSEVRRYLHETDADVNRKINAAINHSLAPIICVGETLEQHHAGEAKQVVCDQVRAAFEGISAADAIDLIVAYEPIWAIGAGQSATPDIANTIIGQIREALRERYSKMVAGEIRILYGGSVTAANIRDIMAQPEIDGALVGGASIKPDEFVRITQIAAEVARKKTTLIEKRM